MFQLIVAYISSLAVSFTWCANVTVKCVKYCSNRTLSIASAGSVPMNKWIAFDNVSWKPSITNVQLFQNRDRSIELSDVANEDMWISGDDGDSFKQTLTRLDSSATTHLTHNSRQYQKWMSNMVTPVNTIRHSFAIVGAISMMFQHSLFKHGCIFVCIFAGYKWQTDFTFVAHFCLHFFFRNANH